MAIDPVLEVRRCLEEASHRYPKYDVQTRIRAYLDDRAAARVSMSQALRQAVENEQLARRFRDDPHVWSALTFLSSTILPLTELYAAGLRGHGPVERWLAIHADLTSGCFRIYEKENDCDREAGYARSVARCDTFDAAVSEVDDRALIDSLDNENERALSP